MSLKQIILDTDTKAGRSFDLFIQSLIVLSLVTFCIETLPSLTLRTRLLLRCIEIVVVVIFTIEYLLRVILTKDSLRFIFSFYGLIDLFAILPFYVSTGIDLRSIRVFRLFRLARVLKLLRYSKAIKRFQIAFTAVKAELIVFTVACVFLLFIASVGIYYFEYPTQPDSFTSVFHCMWWAVATLTTVGYGDIYPITAGGKIFTFFILMVGLGIVAVPTGLIASSLSKVLTDEATDNRDIY